MNTFLTIFCLKNKDDESLLKQIFLMSVDIHSAGKRRFYSNLTNIVDFYSLNNLDLNTETIPIITIILVS